MNSLGCREAIFREFVEEVGGDVTAFRVRDPVFGSGGPGGAYAEFLAVDANLVAPKPAVFSHPEAASLGLVIQTAALSLDEAGLKAGQTVLILGAGGAAANVALQLAKLRGGARSGPYADHVALSAFALLAQMR